MPNKGSFGFIIGRKKRFMKVDDDAELLWRILVREIYVIMKHYGLDKELMKAAFEKIKVVKSGSMPKPSNILRCQRFTDMMSEELGWPNLLRFCQSSFINLLEAGHILLKEDDTSSDDYRFEFDFNTWEARFYVSDKLVQRANLDDIMGFQEMPGMSYASIVSEMDEGFKVYHDKMLQVKTELEKLYRLKAEARNQGAANIEDKVDKLIDDMKWELKELHMGRRLFYHRLKALDLIHVHL
jgi:hypothetical protein